MIFVESCQGNLQPFDINSKMALDAKLLALELTLSLNFCEPYFLLWRIRAWQHPQILSIFRNPILVPPNFFIVVQGVARIALTRQVKVVA